MTKRVFDVKITDEFSKILIFGSFFFVFFSCKAVCFVSCGPQMGAILKKIQRGNVIFIIIQSAYYYYY